MKNKHKGSTLDSFLKKEGLLKLINATAIPRVLAYQIKQNMKKKSASNNFSK